MSWWQFALAAYTVATVVYSAMQAFENWRHGKDGDCWAPVWWIALTWPVWLVVIALDLRWAPHFPQRRDRP